MGIRASWVPLSSYHSGVYKSTSDDLQTNPTVQFYGTQCSIIEQDAALRNIMRYDGTLYYQGTQCVGPSWNTLQQAYYGAQCIVLLSTVQYYETRCIVMDYNAVLWYTVLSWNTIQWAHHGTRCSILKHAVVDYYGAQCSITKMIKQYCRTE